MLEPTKATPDALDAPRIGGNVLPRQVCPCWKRRTTVTLTTARECWNCRYADFQLLQKQATEVGICQYPNVMI